MSLNRLFWFISVVLILLFTVLTACIVFVEWGAYARGAGSAQAVRSLQLVMIAMEKISFERGPSNALMGDREQSPDQLQQLAVARAQTDAAFAAAVAMLQQTSDERYGAPLRKLERVLQGAGQRVTGLTGKLVCGDRNVRLKIFRWLWEGCWT